MHVFEPGKRQSGVLGILLTNVLIKIPEMATNPPLGVYPPIWQFC